MRSTPALLYPTLALLLSGCPGAAPDKPANNTNTNPSAEILGPAVTIAGTITLEGRVSDDQSSAEELLVSWTVNQQALDACTEVPAEPDGSSRCIVSLEEGTYRLSLRVEDPEGLRSGATAELRVAADDPPSIVIDSPEPGRNYYANLPLRFEATVRDNQDLATELVASWSSDLDGDLSGLPTTPTVTGELFGEALLSAGSHTITLSSTDSDGLTGEAQVLVQVVGANTPPSCTLDSPNGQAVANGLEVLISGTAADVDVASDMLQASISSSIQGWLADLPVTASGDFSLSRADLALGDHTLTAVITDDAGETCTATTTVTIGRLPVVTLSEPHGQEVGEGLVVALAATVSDPDEPTDGLSAVWSSDLDGDFATTTPSGGTVFGDTTSLSVGAHQITLTLTDSTGLSGSDSQGVIINGRPGPPGITIQPSDPGSGDDLLAAVVSDSFDPESDPLTYRYQWYQNDVLFPPAKDDWLSSQLTSRGEVWRIVVTPNDGFTDGQAAMMEVTIGNGPPQIAGLSFEPSPPSPGQDVRCVASSVTDPDGDIPTVSYSWQVDGAPVGSTLDTLPASDFTTNAEVRCSASASDASATGAVVHVTDIANDPPTVDVVSLSPVPASSADEVTCVASGVSDVQGDPITLSYAWTLDGVPVSETSEWLPVGSGVRGQRLACTVTPADDQHSGVGVESSPINLMNGAPWPPLAAISPAGPRAGIDDLFCAALSNGDPDGDSTNLALSWELNGGLWNGATLTTVLAGDTIAGGSTIPGDRWTCIATASDVSSSSAPGTDTVTVLP